MSDEMTRVDIAGNIAAVFDAIGRAAARSGRSAEEIDLIAVSKTHSPENLIPAIESGIRAFGENRVQEAEKKIPELEAYDLAWHMIGHLQRNKANTVVQIFESLHSLDSKRLASKIQLQLERDERKEFPVFIQANVSGEQSKYGVPAERVEPLIEMVLRECPRLQPKGLMTIAPWTNDERVLRETFGNLRSLRDKMVERFSPDASISNLSMGMTNDYEIAIEEGATHLRIGRAIFGERET